LWLATAAYNLVKPTSDFSENENRYLAKFPRYTTEDLLEGRFMLGVEDYINDRFVARDFWISMQSVLEYAMGKRESNGVYICSDALIGSIDEPNREYVAGNIKAINNFTKVTGLPAEIMIVPSAAEVQAYKLPRFASPWNQSAEIELIYSNIDDAVCVPVGEALKEHKYEYIYYRTDHHWTSWGAYIAYKAYCETAGITPVEYKANRVSDDFKGTLYSTSGVRFIKSDYIEAYVYSGPVRCDISNGVTARSYDSMYFSEFLDKKDKYAYFLGQNQPAITVYGNSGGGKLLIFKDSYAHCMAPMLLENFSQVTLVDLRYVNRTFDHYFDISEYDRVLFLYSIDSFVNHSDITRLNLIGTAN
jgi:hypothetical protein